MSNKIYGIYGIGMPGYQGEVGDNGYNICVDSSLTKDGSVLYISLDDSINKIDMGEYLDNTKKYQLSSITINTYSKDINSTNKYYQFTYSLNNKRTDDLKIFAYIFFNNSSIYNHINNSNSKYLLLKDFYEPITEIDSNILYDKNKKITKIIVFAFKKIKGYNYEKIFLGEKEF